MFYASIVTFAQGTTIEAGTQKVEANIQNILKQWITFFTVTLLKMKI